MRRWFVYPRKSARSGTNAFARKSNVARTRAVRRRPPSRGTTSRLASAAELRKGRHCALPTFCTGILRSEFNIVADIISSLRKPVIEGASLLVVFVSMPVDTPPAMLPAQSNQSLYECAARAFSARSGRNEKVFQIANRAKAPSMGVEDIVDEPYKPAFRVECEQGTDRLSRRQDTLPEALSGLIRNATIECRTIFSPEAEPVPRIGCLSRAYFYHFHRPMRVAWHVRSITQWSASEMGADFSRTSSIAASMPRWIAPSAAARVNGGLVARNLRAPMPPQEDWRWARRD